MGRRTIIQYPDLLSGGCQIPVATRDLTTPTEVGFASLQYNGYVVSILASQRELLLKERHDRVNHCVECAGGILAGFNEISPLFGMLVEGDEFTDVIFVNQFGTVTAATGSRSGAGDIRWNFPDLAVPAVDRVGSGKHAGQRLGLIRYIVRIGYMARFTIARAVGGIGESNVVFVVHGGHGVREINVTDIEGLEGVDRMDIRIERA